jgi:hypothetical protein
VDINRLYFDHQISAMRATAMPTAILRREAERAASAIAEEIGCIQGALGAPAAPGWERLVRSGHVIAGSSRPSPSSSGDRSVVASTALGRADLAPRPRLQAQSENPDRGRADGPREPASPSGGRHPSGLPAEERRR